MPSEIFLEQQFLGYITKCYFNWLTCNRTETHIQKGVCQCLTGDWNNSEAENILCLAESVGRSNFSIFAYSGSSSLITVAIRVLPNLTQSPSHWICCGGVRQRQFGMSATVWPILPAPVDYGCWVWKAWQGKPKYWERTYSSATLSTTNPTWPDPNPTNCLNYARA
jgi:hypothetical protein